MKEENIMMKVFVADDGRQFLERDKCLEYEKNAKNIRYFAVYHAPELNETGLFTKMDVLAVYSEHGCHYEIAEVWCIRDADYPILKGVSVQGCHFQKYFKIVGGEKDYGFAKKAWENYVHNGKTCDVSSDQITFGCKVFLSPKRIDGFPNNSDYVKRWFGK